MTRRRDSTSVVPVDSGASGGLNLAVSPYHLTTRELTAAVALTLADHAVTVVPEPPEGHSRDDVRRGIERVPRLLRVLESWRWSGSLWRAGLIAGEAGNDRPFAAISAVGTQLVTDPSLARLVIGNTKPRETGDQADRWLDALCTDLLRGGPDPSLSTMTTGALDRFAAAHGFASVRGSTDSLAQRAEIRLMRRRFSIAIPVMSRAAGGRILELRASLQAELAALRGAISVAMTAVGDAEHVGSASLTAAAGDYSEAFEGWFVRAARDDENAERTMRAFVSLTGAILPADSALVCARAAIRGVARVSGRNTAAAVASSPGGQVPPLKAIVIRPMNVRPA